MVNVALLIVLFCLAPAAFSSENLAECRYSRELAVACGREVTDMNGDGLITANEIDAARAASIHWYEKPLALLFTESTEKIMRDCDMDQDGAISQQDYELSALTCLSTCFVVEKTVDYLCARLLDKNEFNDIVGWYKVKNAQD